MEANIRDSKIKPKALRSSGMVPGIYYGRGKTAVGLSLNYQLLRKTYEKAGSNTIVELSMDGKKMPVLIHEIQFDPLFDTISHVDFIHVDMEKEVTTNVKVIIIGTAPAVKNLGGILDVQKHEIKIKCLPKDLIHGIEVDVSGIEDFHTSVHVKDLKVPSTVKILDNPEDTVVTATPQKVEKEETPAVAEGAAPAEGAASAAEGGAQAPGAAPTAAQPNK